MVTITCNIDLSNIGSIRHQNDWGAIILLDARFQQGRITQSLSKWIRPRIKHYQKLQIATQSLKEFVTKNAEVTVVDAVTVVEEAVKENPVLNAATPSAKKEACNPTSVWEITSD